MNRKASNQTRGIRIVLGALPVTVHTSRQFPDTAVRATELEHATTARARLLAAGWKCSEVRAYAHTGFHVYVTQE